MHKRKIIFKNLSNYFPKWFSLKRIFLFFFNNNLNFINNMGRMSFFLQTSKKVFNFWFQNTTERRTLPSEFPGPVSRRRTFQKRSSTLPQENNQTSCSLPETPIFSRGCDIPRTPHRRPPDGIRPGGLQSSTYRRNGTGSNSSNCNTGVSLTGGFNQAIVGAELLRLAGGPGRGWYPRHRHHRPASIEQLDRLAHAGNTPGNGLPGPWDMGSSRKPMTLPPNITPKFFHRSPREALRRVTSLLIRGKGKSIFFQ